MSEQIYGQLSSEKLASDNLVCHKIVSEILNFAYPDEVKLREFMRLVYKYTEEY